LYAVRKLPRNDDAQDLRLEEITRRALHVGVDLARHPHVNA